MSSFANITRGTSSQAGGLDKKELIGEVIVALETGFDPAMETNYGQSPAWTGDILVATGKHIGKYENQRFFGVMARQLHGQTKSGNPVVLKVITGKSTRPGASDWVGVSHEISDSEFDQAQAAANEHSDGPRKVRAF